jgi:hypothetical protein
MNPVKCMLFVSKLLPNYKIPESLNLLRLKKISKIRNTFSYLTWACELPFSKLVLDNRQHVYHRF